MEWGSVADWVGAIGSILVIVAIVQTKNANELLKKQVDEELNPMPRLNFAIVSDHSQKDNYKLIVINYGNSPAIISSETTKNKKGNGYEYIQPNTTKSEVTVFNKIEISDYIKQSQLVEVQRYQELTSLDFSNWINKDKRFAFVFDDKASDKSYEVIISAGEDGFPKVDTKVYKSRDFNNLYNDET